MKNRPLILISNDDGITAPGIKALVEAVKDFGDIVVVAPNSPQSGQSNSITIEDPLRLQKMNIFGDEIEAYACSGTPVDCIKLAKFAVIKERKVDICLSGINHGSNAAINVIYSGTMAAAMEASIEGINAIGFSLLDFSANADFTAAQHYVRKIVRYVLDNGMQNTNLLNVNIPKLPLEEIKGMKICRQGKARWSENFQESVDPRGERYFWLRGEFIDIDKATDSDTYALAQNYVSIVPLQLDLTADKAINELEQLI